MSTEVMKLEGKVNKGKVQFFYTDDKGQEQYYSHFGYMKGKAKWAKVLEADQFGNYAVDIYDGDSKDHFLQHVEDITTQAKELVEGFGKVVNGIADIVKVDDEGTEYFQFKRKAAKTDGTDNTPPKIYDAGGNLATDWDKLVGNGSVVKVGYTLSPYYMATTKMVGVSVKFYAIQVIKLVEYQASSGNTGFGDETSDDTPFDTNEDF